MSIVFYLKVGGGKLIVYQNTERTDYYTPSYRKSCKSTIKYSLESRLVVFSLGSVYLFGKQI